MYNKYTTSHKSGKKYVGTNFGGKIEIKFYYEQKNSGNSMYVLKSAIK